MVNYPPPKYKYVGPPAHLSSGSNFPIIRIVIHSTVSPCMGDNPKTRVKEGAEAIGQYFKSPASGGSAHYITDPNETVQSAWDREVAWHAPPNRGSLGNEMCEIPSRRPGRWILGPQARMLKRVARLTAEECLAYDVPPVKLTVSQVQRNQKGICGHNDVSLAFGQSTHWDPGYFPWPRFLKLVRNEINNIKRGK